jgi:putative nucleotidyltransferase with HDIG domain
MADLEGVRNYVTERLETQLPEGITYHNLRHTLAVHDAACKLAAGERIGEAELELLETAAFCHDIGYTVTSKGHEEKGAEMVAGFLPEFGYDGSEIAGVQGLILATRMPQKPSGLGEEIICDADISLLGSGELLEVGDDMRREFGIGDLGKWYEIEVGFLGSHKYFTPTARAMWDSGKAKNLEHYRGLLEEYRGGGQ